MVSEKECRQLEEEHCSAEGEEKEENN